MASTPYGMHLQVNLQLYEHLNHTIAQPDDLFEIYVWIWMDGLRQSGSFCELETVLHPHKPESHQRSRWSLGDFQRHSPANHSTSVQSFLKYCRKQACKVAKKRQSRKFSQHIGCNADIVVFALCFCDVFWTFKWTEIKPISYSDHVFFWICFLSLVLWFTFLLHRMQLQILW